MTRALSPAWNAAPASKQQMVMPLVRSVPAESVYGRVDVARVLCSSSDYYSCCEAFMVTRASWASAPTLPLLCYVLCFLRLCGSSLLNYYQQERLPTFFASVFRKTWSKAGGRPTEFVQPPKMARFGAQRAASRGWSAAAYLA